MQESPPRKMEVSEKIGRKPVKTGLRPVGGEVVFLK